MTRMILRECFDTYSYGATPSSAEPDPTAGQRTGSLQHSGPREAFIASARASDTMHFIKTHVETPAAGDRAIYIVRDGRAAVASYQRYLRDFDHVEFALSDIAAGKPIGLSWAQHIRRWQKLPNLLFLRYEDLTGPDGPPLATIGAFIGKPVLRPFSTAFSTLQSEMPKFFGVGANRPGVEQLEREGSAAFWKHNGAMMRKLDYGLPPPRSRFLPAWLARS